MAIIWRSNWSSHQMQSEFRDGIRGWNMSYVEILILNIWVLDLFQVLMTFQWDISPPLLIWRLFWVRTWIEISDFPIWVGGMNIRKRYELLGTDWVLIHSHDSIVSWCQLMFLTRPPASLRPSPPGRKSSHGQTISGSCRLSVTGRERRWTCRVYWRSLQWKIFIGFHRGSTPNNITQYLEPFHGLFQTPRQII